jgi:acyl dehydratase
MSQDLLAKAKKRRKGHQYEDFSIGQVFDHHWGRTLTAGDNSLFTTLTHSFVPLYFNAEYARAQGHPDMVCNPMLVFDTVFGLSVEDLSEGGGLFLGVDEMNHLQPVYPGDTLTARSEVIEKRESESRPGMGIVTWHTEGFNQRGERVIEFRRTNFVVKRGGA